MSIIETLKVIVLGIVEGFTEWLPISSTGHMILVDEIIHLKQPEDFKNMFMVVIQLGAILAVVVMYFHKLNPFSPTKKPLRRSGLHSELWSKIILACIPAAVIGLLIDDIMEKYLMNGYVVAATLIIYGVLFIVIENANGIVILRCSGWGYFLPDGALYRPFPAPVPGSGYLPVRFHDSGRHDPWLLQRRCRRVFLLPGNPRHVWSQLLKNCKIRPSFHRSAGLLSASRYGGGVHCIGVRNPFPDGIYQKTRFQVLWLLQNCPWSDRPGLLWDYGSDWLREDMLI